MKRRIRPSETVSHRPNQLVFWSLVSASFIALVCYRAYFLLPVWFDEIVAKSVIFGLPFLLFVLFSKRSVASFGLDPRKFWLGAYLGLALGGSFGFVAMLASALKTGGQILIPNLFFASDFWWTFFLALATAWWESLFFYGFILNVFLAQKKNEWQAALMATVVFVVFHAPVLLLRGSLAGAFVPLMLLSLFALGQAIIYIRFRSLIAMVVSHAFWGMALLVYTLR